MDNAFSNRPFHTETGKFRNIQCVNHGEKGYASALPGASTTMTTPRVWHSITHSTRNCWRVEVILLCTTLKTTPALLWNYASKVHFLTETFDMKMSIIRVSSVVCGFNACVQHVPRDHSVRKWNLLARRTPRNDFGFLDWNIYFHKGCNYSNDANEMCIHTSIRDFRVCDWLNDRTWPCINSVHGPANNQYLVPIFRNRYDCF